MNVQEKAAITRSMPARCAIPRVSGPRRRARSTGSSRRRRSSIPRWASTAAGSPARVVNTCYNALDRHVAGGRADQVALIHDSPLTNTRHQIHLCRAAERGADARRDHAGFRRRQGRPRHPLYADGAGSGGRDAGLRAHRRGALRGVRRFCREGTRDPHRRRQAETDLLGELRHRARPHRAIQAAARRGDQARQRQAGGLHHPAAAAAWLRSHAGPRP